jgi:MtN3 and saliva related transmembrane protein
MPKSLNILSQMGLSMLFDTISWLGIAAGSITSIGFLPQLIRGYKTKKLDDVSYWMPCVLVIGMSLWLAYGVLRSDIAQIAANSFAVFCNILLLVLKKIYSSSPTLNVEEASLR